MKIVQYYCDICGEELGETMHPRYDLRITRENATTYTAHLCDLCEDWLRSKIRKFAEELNETESASNGYPIGSMGARLAEDREE